MFSVATKVLEFDFDNGFTAPKDVLSWLQANCEGKFSFDFDFDMEAFDSFRPYVSMQSFYRMQINFESERDAALYKLFWV